MHCLFCGYSLRAMTDLKIKLKTMPIQKKSTKNSFASPRAHQKTRRIFFDGKIYAVFHVAHTCARNNYIDANAEHIYLKNTIKPMKKALDYVDNNLGSNLTLKDIASRASMSPTYFSKRF